MLDGRHVSAWLLRERIPVHLRGEAEPQSVSQSQGGFVFRFGLESIDDGLRGNLPLGTDGLPFNRDFRSTETPLRGRIVQSRQEQPDRSGRSRDIQGGERSRQFFVFLSFHFTILVHKHSLVNGLCSHLSIPAALCDGTSLYAPWTCAVWR